jgi:hypothetical protein
MSKYSIILCILLLGTTSIVLAAEIKPSDVAGLFRLASRDASRVCRHDVRRDPGGGERNPDRGIRQRRCRGDFHCARQTHFLRDLGPLRRPLDPVSNPRVGRLRIRSSLDYRALTVAADFLLVTWLGGCEPRVSPHFSPVG